MGVNLVNSGPAPCTAGSIPPEYQGSPFNGRLFSRFPTAHASYNESLNQRRAGAETGELPQETLDFFVQNHETLAQDMDALVEAITLTSVEDEPGRRGVVPGGVVQGQGWVGKSLIGLTLARWNIAASYNWWRYGNEQCQPIPCMSIISNFVATGNIVLGTFQGYELGGCSCGCLHDDWENEFICEGPGCWPPGNWCFCYLQSTFVQFGCNCQSYYVSWKQKLGFITISSGTTAPQEVRTPCTEGSFCLQDQ